MLKKYRVRELSKDLKVTNKEVIQTLSSCFEKRYTYMSALNEDELDVVLELHTKKFESENFDSFFSLRKNTVDITEDNFESIIDSYSKDKKQKNKKVFDSSTKKDDVSQLLEFSKKNEDPKISSVVIKKKETESINTRTENINISKYDKKYDQMASEQQFVRKVDSSVSKQKFSKNNKKNFKFKKKESELERLKRIELERKAKPLKVLIPDEITVSELAVRLKAQAKDVIKKLISLGTMASVNDVVDFDTASLVALEFNAKVQKEKIVSIEDLAIDNTPDAPESLKSRPPVVVVMGHVDHGKTSILDYIRKSNVVSAEQGGITQHIGAYKAFANGKSITFLDTPGHEAFTSMRARGANATDIAVLVVAADDGIMPQTIEAINHAKDAKVSIIVAINKIDKPGANIEKVKQQLMEYSIVPEEWGGDTICVPVSAKTGEGIDELLNMIILSSDMLELRANPSRNAHGIVIESRVDKGKGVVSTFLVTNGTLKKGDVIIAGTSFGRVRSMCDSSREPVSTALPSDPVEVTGLDVPPFGGDLFDVVSDEHLAHNLVEKRKFIKFSENSAFKPVNSTNILDVLKKQGQKTLKIIIKADVNGSAEALKQSLERLSNDEVSIKVIHSAVGAVNESDVMLASVSGNLIIGFNVHVDSRATESAKDNGVDIKVYRIIYDCINDIKKMMDGMLTPETEEVVIGTAECRKVFKISSIGTIAGCYVPSGKIIRGASARVIRDGIIKADDKISSLQINRNDAKEVLHGFECGILMEKFSDLKVGDIIECYSIENVKK